MTKKPLYVVFAFLMLFVLVGCFDVEQDRVKDAQAVVEVPEKVNYFQRQQIAEAEAINDDPFRVFFWYVNFAEEVKSFTCIGRPASSTESMEPNQISPYYSMDRGFRVYTEGGDDQVYSGEGMGLDGTFGEEIPYRFCITPEGEYVDVSMFMEAIVTTRPMVFADSGKQFDQELEAKKLIAQQILARGGCIDSALNEIECTDNTPNFSELDLPAVPTESTGE